MLPFITRDLETLIRNLSQRFVKSNILNDAKTTVALLKIDPKKLENHLSQEKVDLGFVAQKQLSSLLKNKSVSPRQAFEFRSECLTFLANITGALVEKTPIKYRLVRNISCLDPQVMCTTPDVAVTRFGRVLELLVDANRLKSCDVDAVKNRFSEFVRTARTRQEFVDFNQEDPTCRLDTVMYEALTKDSKNENLWKVISKLLLLSHGQASIERGFSVNKYTSVDNLSPQNLVSLRLIKDHIRSVGGLKNVEVSNEMINSGLGARQRYEADLNSKRDVILSAAQKRKSDSIADELQELKKNKKMIQAEVNQMTSQSKKLYEKAETTGNVTFVASANTLRREAKSKQTELEGLDHDICVKELKNVKK
jgi:hypothetical protein